MSKNTLEFQCPSCTKRVGIEESQIGSVLPCTHCAATVRVPSDRSLLFHVREVNDLVEKQFTPVISSKKRARNPKSFVRWLMLIGFSLLLIGGALVGYIAHKQSLANMRIEFERLEKIEKERQDRVVEARRIDEEKQLTLEKQKKLIEAERVRLELEKQKKLAADQQREQERQQLAEAEARRIAEEKEKEEANKLEYEQGEIALIRQTEKELIPVLKQAQFKEATENLRLIGTRLKTNKGKEEYVLSQERISCVQEFHKTIVSLATGFRFARGGIIESSNQTEITILGKKVLWSEIYATRPEIVNDLIEGLVLREQRNAKANITEKTKLITNAALCLFLLYSDVPSALDKSKRMLAMTLKEDPGNMITVKKLFPDIVEELSDIKYQPDCERCKERYCAQCRGKKVCMICTGTGVATCTSCGGQGQSSNRGLATCGRCGGSGFRSEYGAACMTCKGTGSISQATLSACDSCSGKGRVRCGACQGARVCSACNGTGTSGDRCPGCGKN